MTGARPEQAALTRHTDWRRRGRTRAVIGARVNGLNDSRIADMGAFFHESFRWMGNRGCGTKESLAAFQGNWQRLFQAAFGRQEATHRGAIIGIPASGKRVTIRYMDPWRVTAGRIADNRGTVDFADVAAQLSVDLFDGHGRASFDRGDAVPPRPETRDAP